MKDSFVFYRSFYESTKGLPDDSRLRLFDNICELALNGKDIDGLYGFEVNIFTLIRPQIEANNQRYENGKKGGRPSKKTIGYEKEKTNGYETEKPNVNVNDNENVNVNENEYICEFENLWKLYPKKIGKKDALRHYIRNRKKGVSYEVIETGLKQYNEYIKNQNILTKYIKDGSTWFNQESWNDERVIEHVETEEEWVARMEREMAENER